MTSWKTLNTFKYLQPQKDLDLTTNPIHYLWYIHLLKCIDQIIFVFIIEDPNQNQNSFYTITTFDSQMLLDNIIIIANKSIFSMMSITLIRQQ